MTNHFQRPTAHVRATRIATPEWHEPRHRLWEGFCNAMNPCILHEPDWIQYKTAHDLEEDPEVEEELEKVRRLLDS